MSCGRDELALLDVDDAAGAAGGQQEVRLAAEEGGNLQDIRDFGGRFGLRRLVDIGEDRIAGGLQAGEDAQTFAQARAAVSTRAGAVGFVEGGFEDEIAGGRGDGPGHEVDVLFAFDHARPGDQHQRLAEAQRR